MKYAFSTLSLIFLTQYLAAQEVNKSNDFLATEVVLCAKKEGTTRIETEIIESCSDYEIALKKYIDAKYDYESSISEIDSAGPASILYFPKNDEEHLAWFKIHFDGKLKPELICNMASMAVNLQTVFSIPRYTIGNEKDGCLIKGPCKSEPHITNETFPPILLKSAQLFVSEKYNKQNSEFFGELRRPYCDTSLGNLSTRGIAKQHQEQQDRLDKIKRFGVNGDPSFSRILGAHLVDYKKLKESAGQDFKTNIHLRTIVSKQQTLLAYENDVKSKVKMLDDLKEAREKGFSSREDLIQAKRWGAKNLHEFNIFKMAQEFGVNRSIMTKIYDLQINSSEKYIETKKELLSLNYSNSTVPSGDEILQFLLDKRDALNKGMKIIDYKNQRLALLAKEKEDWELRQNKIRESQIQKEKIDRINYEKEYPYEAIIDCEWNGRSVKDLRLCLMGDNNSLTEICVNNNGLDPKIYNFNSISSITRNNQGVAKIPLRSRFELRAQNADNTRTMTVSIFDTKSGELLRKEALGFRKSVTFRN